MESPAELGKLKQEIAALGNELERLGREKEALYREKKVLDDSLSAAIAEAKSLKEKKHNIDVEIKNKKILRTALNKEIKSISLKIKPVMRQRGPASADIKRQIEAMQYAIETEGLSFEREKNYMDRIKQLKAKLAEVEGENSEAQVSTTARQELSAKKSQADSLHLEIQKLAEESSKLFVQLTDMAQKITSDKLSKNALQDKLKDFKAKIEAQNQALSQALNNWLETSKSAPTAVMPTAEELMNKFKNTKRLTKEDILKLQRLAAKQ